MSVLVLSAIGCAGIPSLRWRILLGSAANCFRFASLVHLLGHALLKSVTNGVLLFEPALELFLVDVAGGRRVTLVQRRFTLDFCQALRWRFTRDLLD